MIYVPSVMRPVNETWSSTTLNANAKPKFSSLSDCFRTHRIKDTEAKIVHCRSAHRCQHCARRRNLHRQHVSIDETELANASKVSRIKIVQRHNSWPFHLSSDSLNWCYAGEQPNRRVDSKLLAQDVRQPKHSEIEQYRPSFTDTDFGQHQRNVVLAVVESTSYDAFNDPGMMTAERRYSKSNQDVLNDCAFGVQNKLKFFPELRSKMRVRYRDAEEAENEILTRPRFANAFIIDKRSRTSVAREAFQDELDQTDMQLMSRTKSFVRRMSKWAFPGRQARTELSSIRRKRLGSIYPQKSHRLFSPQADAYSLGFYNSNERISSIYSSQMIHNSEVVFGSSSSDSNSQISSCEECKKVVINVSGLKFETWLSILESRPSTLLGNKEKREAYWDSKRNEYFFDHHRPSFEAIFNYYQYGGQVKRPPTVPDEVFLSELEFFQIETETVECYKRNEGYVNEVIVLPEKKWKRRLWLLFEYPETSASAFGFSVASVAFTVISIILFCVETLPVFDKSHCGPNNTPNFNDPFFIIETFCTMWFTFELIIRLISCPSHKKFIIDVKNLIDLTAIVPYYITLSNVLITFNCEGAKSSASLAFLRVIRLVRVFKLTKHSSGLQVLVLTFKESIEGLGLFLVAFVVCILLFSSAIYYVEIDHKGSQIESIPDAFWWAVITMCTVGYGDKVPKSFVGKIVGSFCAIAGVLTLAIPVPIITENFNKFYAHKTGRGRR